MTRAQARALDELWPRFGIDAPHGRLDLGALFGRDAPRCLEIGFGNGDALLAAAAGDPATDFLGAEVHEPGVGHLLLELARRDLRNVRVIRHDAVDVLASWLPDACLAAVLLFFPDPWHKKRHHKRRIVQPGFLREVARVLAPGGRLHMATDWEHYALHMRDAGNACPWLDNESATGDFVDRPGERPLTRFEQRGQRLGHDVWDLRFRRNDRPLSAED